jgi:uncharacterized protein (DUF1501 family)
MPRPPGLTRRGLLKRGAVGAAAAAFGAPFFVNRRLYAGPTPYQTQYVVYVMYSGGVRTMETWGTPSNIPRMSGLKSLGALHTGVIAPSNGHDQAKLANISGSKTRTYDRRNYRNDNPTIYEYFRKSLGIPASECWAISESAGVNAYLNYSKHPSYGAKYGANFVTPDVFRSNFRDVLKRFATIQTEPAQTASQVDDLRASLDKALLANVVDVPIGNTDAERGKITNFLMSHAASGYSGSSDQQALKIATDVIDAFHPRLLGITLMTHDVGHGGIAPYVTAIQQSDALVGTLWDHIQTAGNPMKDKTTMVVVPEHGRDAAQNAQGGLDHNVYSDATTKYVSLFAIGPDIKQNVDLTSTYPGWQAMSLVPTLGKLMGASTPYCDAGITSLDALLTA